MQKQERKNGKHCTCTHVGWAAGAWPAGSAPRCPGCMSVAGGRAVSASHTSSHRRPSGPARSTAQGTVVPFSIPDLAAAPATGRGKRRATPRAPRNRVVVSSKTPPEISIRSVRVISGSVAGLLRSEMSESQWRGDREGSLWAVASRAGSNGFFYRFNYIESRLIRK